MILLSWVMSKKREGVAEREGDNGKTRVCPPVAPPTTQGRRPVLIPPFSGITSELQCSPLPSPTEKCRSKDPSPPSVPHESGERPPRLRRNERKRKFRVRLSVRPSESLLKNGRPRFVVVVTLQLFNSPD